MNGKRRRFLKTTGFLGLSGICGHDLFARKSPVDPGQSPETVPLSEHYRSRVIRSELLPGPVVVDSLKLLRRGENWFVRAESKDGAVGLAMGHVKWLPQFHPLFVQLIAPFFEGKDARGLDALVDAVYESENYYKMQGLPFWICVASAEFALLDLLGRVADEPVAELLGGLRTKTIDLYRANNYRDRDAEASLARIAENVAETGVKALKIKVGGRMLKGDRVPDRTRQLVAKVARAFGSTHTLYADANSSYLAPEAVRVGRLLQDHGFAFFEEPVPFDFHEETRRVARKLRIPIAGGEQESSLYRFWWLIAHGALQVAQPDLFYFGGMIRSMRVAEMAEAAGIQCVPHISGSGMGFLYMAVFASCAPAMGPYQEFKGLNREVPWEPSGGGDLVIKDGRMTVPTGPGMGVDYDPGYLAGAREVMIGT